MSGLKYVGRAPDADFSVTHKNYVDTRYDLVKVDSAYVAAAIGNETDDLVLPTYVDAQDALRAKKTAVDTADGNYLLYADRGATNGIASTDGSNFIPSGQLPTIQTARKVLFKDVDTVTLTGTREVTGVVAKEFQAATLTVADPGYPYILLPFAQIQGGAQNASTPANGLGTGNYGQISILRASDDKRYGWTVTTGQKQFDFTTVTPYGAEDSDITTTPPITGATTLNLWLGLYGGTTYSFIPAGLLFYTFIYPAI